MVCPWPPIVGRTQFRPLGPIKSVFASRSGKLNLGGDRRMNSLRSWRLVHDACISSLVSEVEDRCATTHVGPTKLARSARSSRTTWKQPKRPQAQHTTATIATMAWRDARNMNEWTFISGSVAHNTDKQTHKHTDRQNRQNSLSL